jgi:hypothetical protein
MVARRRVAPRPAARSRLALGTRPGRCRRRADGVQHRAERPRRRVALSRPTRARESLEGQRAHRRASRKGEAHDYRERQVPGWHDRDRPRPGCGHALPGLPASHRAPLLFRVRRRVWSGTGGEETRRQAAQLGNLPRPGGGHRLPGLPIELCASAREHLVVRAFSKAELDAMPRTVCRRERDDENSKEQPKDGDAGSSDQSWSDALCESMTACTMCTCGECWVLLGCVTLKEDKRILEPPRHH